MAKLVHDAVGARLYETGVKRAVLYPKDNAGAYPLGHAWNGVTAITDAPTGGEPTALYADDIKYLELMSVEEYGFGIEAYTYPDEFEACDGTAELSTGVRVGQQTRQGFGMVWLTTIGNDTEGEAYGYKIHIAYDCKAAPSDKAYNTINDNPEAATMSWDVTTTPVPVTGHKATANIVIDSTKIAADDLTAVLDALYGTDVADAYLPLPDDLLALITP